MQLVDNNPDVAQSFNNFPGPQIYYDMAHKNYPEALALIKSCINSPNVPKPSETRKHCSKPLAYTTRNSKPI